MNLPNRRRRLCGRIGTDIEHPSDSIRCASICAWILMVGSSTWGLDYHRVLLVV